MKHREGISNFQKPEGLDPHQLKSPRMSAVISRKQDPQFMALKKTTNKTV